MSRVTNAILTAQVRQGDSDPEIDSVNRFLRETEGGGGGEFIEANAVCRRNEAHGMSGIPVSV